MIARAAGLAALLVACAPAPQGYTTVHVEDLRAAQGQGVTILDVRTPAEYAQGHVAGARLLPLQELPERVGEVPQDRPVYVICHSGNRSAQASQILAKRGYRNIHNVDGGMNAWAGAGFPVVR